jgi:hypothetical protein
MGCSERFSGDLRPRLDYFAQTPLDKAAALLYFELLESDFFKQVVQEQSAFFTQVQDGFVQRDDAAAPAYLLRVYEAGNVNLTRLFANVLWEKDFAPFVAKARRIPVDQCRAIGDVKDADGKTVQPGEKQACFPGSPARGSMVSCRKVIPGLRNSLAWCSDLSFPRVSSSVCRDSACAGGPWRR